MNIPGADMIFVTVVNSQAEAVQAALMIDSLRAFGGDLQDSDVLVFLPNGDQPGDLSKQEHVTLLPLEMEESFRHYALADKVFACAEAEARVASQTASLAWINLDCLFVNPPVLFELDPAHDAAFRPVHLRNVGSLVSQPLDDYWKRIYACVGMTESKYSVESFVDARLIRPYFNTHCFSINPALGVFQAWRKYFEMLITDSDFQAGPCGDELHRVFLHQVVLSALVMKRIDHRRIRMLPPEYSYPLHLQDRLSPSRRFASLNSTICTVYEDANVLSRIEVEEPLKSWLTAHPK
jgi:hypothetical protein